MEYLFESPTMRLHLMLNGKFNVIVGNSGTGKSYLCSLVEEIRTTYGYAERQPMPVCGGATAAASIPLWANEYQGALLVLDEMQVPELWQSYLKIMKASHNYYIICTREGDANIPYGLNTVFTLERTKTYLRMLPAYRNLGTRRPRNFNSIVTEDSGLGFDVVSKRSSVPVVSAKGKDNIAETIRRCSERALVLLDLCGVGMAYPRIFREAQENKALLFDSNSFEYEVLSTVFQKESFTPYEELCLDYSSEESYYVSVLGRLILELYRADYTKSSAELADVLVNGKGMVRGKFVDLIADGFKPKALYPFL